MRQKFFVLFLFALNFAVLPHAAADTKVVVDTVTTEKAADLNLQVPVDTPPGEHEMVVDINNPDGSLLKHQEIAFCIDLEGVVHWDNKCPDVPADASAEELASIKDVNKLPNYSPLKDPKRTNQNTVAALALLSSIGAGAAGSIATVKILDIRNTGASEGPERGELREMEQEELERIEAEERGWGDRHPTWKFPFTDKVDRFFTIHTNHISAVVPMLARSIIDGHYLRAMFGSLSALLNPLALYFGVAAAAGVSFQAMPPRWHALAPVMALGILDSAAGIAGSAGMFLGVLVTGHMNSMSHLLTMIGVCAICFAPAILVSALRPIRRLIDEPGEHWERVADYLLGALLVGYTVSKMIEGLNGLGGKQFAIRADSHKMVIVAMIFFCIRLALEDAATYLYPKRLGDTHVTLAPLSERQKATSLLAKMTGFILVAKPFVGNSPQLYIGALIFCLPLIIDITVAEHYERSHKIGRWTPKASVKIMTLTMAGGVIAYALHQVFRNPHQYLAWSFVLLTVPSAIIGTMEDFGEEEGTEKWHQHGFGLWFYRIFGIVILVALAYVVRGSDVADNVIKFVTGK